jgi:hypothetical protein
MVLFADPLASEENAYDEPGASGDKNVIPGNDFPLPTKRAAVPSTQVVTLPAMNA